MSELRGARVLVTGLTGQVGKPVATALAAHNEVVGVARFSNPTVRAELEAAGVRCVTADLVTADFGAVPSEVEYVLNFAVAKSGRWDVDLAANVEGLGLLLDHCRAATAVLHCSSTAVYQADGHRAFNEDDPLGDNHRVILPTYSISKIAAEAMARYAARAHGVPTTVARLNVPYGDNGGWPWLHLEQILADQPVWVHEDEPSLYNPIHEDDIVAMIPRLLEIASVPATTVNWGGVEAVSVEQWAAELARLVGREVRFEKTPHTLESVTIDTTRMTELVGLPEVDWRDGMRRMVQHFHPEIDLPG